MSAKYELYTFRIPAHTKITVPDLRKWCDTYFQFWVFYELDNYYQGEGLLKIESPSNYIPKQYRNKDWFLWEKFVLETGKQECLQKEETKLHWIHDPTGHARVSRFAGKVELYNKGIDVPHVTNYQEVTEVLTTKLKNRNERSPGIILIPSPPQTNLTHRAWCLSAIKLGKLQDEKYERFWFDTPSVWIYSNSKPPMKDLLEDDDWRIWTFDGPDDTAMLIPYVDPKAKGKAHTPVLPNPEEVRVD